MCMGSNGGLMSADKTRCKSHDGNLYTAGGLIRETYFKKVPYWDEKLEAPNPRPKGIPQGTHRVF